MFKNNQDGQDFFNGNKAEDTIIGRAIKIEGDLSSDGNIVIEGEVKGSVRTGKFLKIGDAAKVTANVEAESAIVSGEVDGNVSVRGKLELTATAKVAGDICASRLSIAEGALFNGACKMDSRTAETVVSEE
jgi:cytoskeletal protein CcmA (bactofilin family)